MIKRCFSFYHLNVVCCCALSLCSLQNWPWWNKHAPISELAFKIPGLIKHGGISVSSIQRSASRGFIIELYLTCCTAHKLTERTVKCQKQYAAWSSMASLPRATFSPHSHITPPPFSITVCSNPSNLSLLSDVLRSSSIPNFLFGRSPRPPPAPPRLQSASSCVRSCALRRLGWSVEAHQAFLALLHSAAAASSLPLSPPRRGCGSCSRLQGSSVCRRAPLWSGEPRRLQANPWWLGDIFKRWC